MGYILSDTQLSPVKASPRLEESLSNLVVPQLKWLTHALVDRPPLRKGELVEFLAKRLGDPVEVGRLWALLAPIERQVIAEVVHNLDGRYQSNRIQAKYPGAPSPYVSSYYGYGEKQATIFDLLFCCLSSLEPFVPHEVAAIVCSIAPKPAPMQVASCDEPPARKPRHADPELTGGVMLVATEHAVFHDLTATLHLIQEGKLGVGASQLPTLPGLRHLRTRLQVGDYLDDLDYDKAEDAIRPLALVVLVQAAKWAIPSGQKGSRLALTKSGQALLGHPLEARHIRDVWERWLNSDIVDELSRIRNIKGQQSKRTRLTRPPDRRHRLASALSACPVGRWVEVKEFFRFMRAEGLDPDVERGEYSGLYVGYSLEYGWLGMAGVSYWNILVGSYLRALLMEYVATLGMVEIAHICPEDAEWQFGVLHGVDDLAYFSRYDGLLAFRLTNLGAYVLGLTDQYTPPGRMAVQPFLKVLPNLDLVVVDAAAVAPNDRALLAKVGVEQSQDVYRLNRDKLIEAAEHGVSVHRVIEFLCTGSGLSEAELPQTLRVFLADVEKRLGALQDGGKALVLEADDGFLLVELARNASLRELVRIANVDGKPVLLVSEQWELSVRRQLKKLGYLPTRRISDR